MTASLFDGAGCLPGNCADRSAVSLRKVFSMLLIVQAAHRNTLGVVTWMHILNSNAGIAEVRIAGRVGHVQKVIQLEFAGRYDRLCYMECN